MFGGRLPRSRANSTPAAIASPCASAVASSPAMAKRLQAAVVVLGLVLVAQGRGVAVAGMVGGDRRPGGCSRRRRGRRPSSSDRVNSATRTGAGLQRARGVADRLEVLRHAELGRLAQADHQHARRGDAGQVVQQRGPAGLAGDVAALEQGAQAAAAGAVEGLRRPASATCRRRRLPRRSRSSAVAGAAWFRVNSRLIKQIP